MSVFQFITSAPVPIVKRITGNTVTTVLDATNNTLFVPWFQVNEVAGGTQNLTVDVYDGTNALYQGDDNGATWVTKAVTAKASYRFSQGIAIAKGSLLRVTSSAVGGDFHVSGVYVIVQ